MQIRKHGLVLSQLTIDDIELVRQHRNSQQIRQFMHYQEEITPTMQLEWFQSINNNNHQYFIVQTDGKKIGLTHGKLRELSQGELIAEGGVFIWDQSYWGTAITVACSMIMNDFTFFIVGVKATYAKVLRSNQTVINYNLKMGYQITQEEEDIIWMKLTQDNYEKSIAPIRKKLAIFTKDIEPLTRSNIHFIY